MSDESLAVPLPLLGDDPPAEVVASLEVTARREDNAVATVFAADVPDDEIELSCE
jgi:hypothetical protein